MSYFDQYKSIAYGTELQRILNIQGDLWDNYVEAEEVLAGNRVRLYPYHGISGFGIAMHDPSVHTGIMVTGKSAAHSFLKNVISNIDEFVFYAVSTNTLSMSGIFPTRWLMMDDGDIYDEELERIYHKEEWCVYTSDVRI